MSTSNDNFNDNYFTIFFDAYNNDEIRLLKNCFYNMHSSMIKECMGTDIDCSHCKYRKLCANLLLLYDLLNIEDQYRYWSSKLETSPDKTIYSDTDVIP